MGFILCKWSRRCNSSDVIGAACCPWYHEKCTLTCALPVHGAACQGHVSSGSNSPCLLPHSNWQKTWCLRDRLSAVTETFQASVARSPSCSVSGGRLAGGGEGPPVLWAPLPGAFQPSTDPFASADKGVAQKIPEVSSSLYMAPATSAFSLHTPKSHGQSHKDTGNRVSSSPSRANVNIVGQLVRVSVRQ